MMGRWDDAFPNADGGEALRQMATAVLAAVGHTLPAAEFAMVEGALGGALTPRAPAVRRALELDPAHGQQQQTLPPSGGGSAAMASSGLDPLERMRARGARLGLSQVARTILAPAAERVYPIGTGGCPACSNTPAGADNHDADDGTAGGAGEAADAEHPHAARHHADDVVASVPLAASLLVDAGFLRLTPGLLAATGESVGSTATTTTTTTTSSSSSSSRATALPSSTSSSSLALPSSPPSPPLLTERARAAYTRFNELRAGTAACARGSWILCDPRATALGFRASVPFGDDGDGDDDDDDKDQEDGGENGQLGENIATAEQPWPPAAACANVSGREADPFFSVVADDPAIAAAATWALAVWRDDNGVADDSTIGNDDFGLEVVGANYIASRPLPQHARESLPRGSAMPVLVPAHRECADVTCLVATSELCHLVLWPRRGDGDGDGDADGDGDGSENAVPVTDGLPPTDVRPVAADRDDSRDPGVSVVLRRGEVLVVPGIDGAPFATSRSRHESHYIAVRFARPGF
jgi:hypothetical protein